MTNGGPAFPMCPDYDASASGVLRQVAPGEQGMSLRDYLAAAALTGILANEDRIIEATESAEGDTARRRQMLSRFCYQQADDMLREREVNRG